jgi:hypothetical protein
VQVKYEKRLSVCFFFHLFEVLPVRVFATVKKRHKNRTTVNSFRNGELSIHPDNSALFCQVFTFYRIVAFVNLFRERKQNNKTGAKSTGKKAAFVEIPPGENILSFD